MTTTLGLSEELNIDVGCWPPFCLQLQTLIRYPKIWIDGKRDVQDPLNVFFRRVLRTSLNKELIKIDCATDCKCTGQKTTRGNWETKEFEANVVYHNIAYKLSGTYDVRLIITTGNCS